MPTLATSLSQFQAQDQQVKAQLSSEQSSYEATAAAATQTQQKLDSVNASLHAAQNHYYSLNASLGAVQTQLFVTLNQLVKLQNDIQSKQSLVAADLRLIYENGNVSYLSVVLGANSFSDFLTRLGNLEAIVASEVTLLRQIQAEKIQTTQVASQLQGQKNQLLALESQVQAQETSFQTQAAARQQLLATLSQQKAQETAIIKQLEATDSQLMAAINQLEGIVGTLTPAQLQTMINQIAQQYGVDPALISAIIQQESGGNPNAVSSAGAEGLMQLMPGTAAGLGVTNALNPQQNLQGGTQYFTGLLQKYNGNICLAAAAYNAGPGAVAKYGGIPPYPETQNYVKDVVAIYQRNNPGASVGCNPTTGATVP